MKLESISSSEVVVVIVCLAAGYWIVSKFFTRHGPAKPQEQAKEHPASGSREEKGIKAQTKQTPWHEILGVSAQANMDEIRQAYKITIGQYHPDKVATLGPELRALAERKSKEINNAYQLAQRLRGGRK